jgi:hypothetical protein
LGRSGVVAGVVRGIGVLVLTGLAVLAGDIFGKGVGVGLSESSVLMARADFWDRSMATTVKVIRSSFIGYVFIRFVIRDTGKSLGCARTTSAVIS